ncbi:TonB-dependent receptor [Novosphingobium sp. Rr 2-17]|uniref:TonB-dependent receptor n=1 Tax=Novosphingobium sp. Rr 2-17 TaxID=555793 RepID=UPI0006943628|nr:TonB-dependent receptor [Novosphingobium sp. Rr 2-17]
MALLASAAAATFAQPAQAETGEHRFDIPAQAVSSSLQTFARQSGKHVLFPYDATRGRVAPVISGKYEDAYVLNRLASAAGLIVSSNDGNTITLAAPSRPARATSPVAYMAPANSAATVATAEQSAATSDDQAAPTSTQGLEEIVVTAQRRSEDLQQAALSVTVRTGEEMLAQGRYSLESILTDVPGVSGGASTLSTGSATGTDSPSASLIIRGIPSNTGVAGTTTSVASSAAIYVDGVYNGNGGNYDISRIEVLRGPQGTLYGRSATTGLVAIHTRDPELDKFGADGSVEVANYDTRRVGGAINIPLIDDQLALRVSGNYYTRNGYVLNGQGGSLTNKNLRAKLLYKPTDNFSLLLGVAGENSDLYSSGTTVQFPATGDYIVASNPIGAGVNKTRQYWAEANLDLGSATLSYIPAFRTWTSYSMNYARNPALPSGGNQALNTPKDDFMTHELRLASNGDGPLKWQVGALYYRNVLHNEQISRDSVSNALTSSSDTHRTTDAIGGFGEATYSFSPDTRFTGGLRYDYTKVQVSQVYTVNSGLTLGGAQGSLTYGLPEILSSRTLSGADGRRTFTNLTYKARIEHDLSPSNMVYALTSTGVAPGDVTLATGVDNSPTVVTIGSETLTSYEIGSKNRFLNNKLQVNGSVFYYVYGGYQVANINISPIASIRSYTTLSSPARAYGGELEVLYRPTSNDRFSINVSYTNAYFVDREDQIVPGSGGKTFDYYYHRKKIPGVVPFNAQFAYDHTFDLSGGSRLTVRGDIRYLSPYAVAPINQVQDTTTNAYAQIHNNGDVLGNLSASWNSEDGKYMLSAYMRNVTNNRYKTIGIVTTAPTGTFVSGTISDPRTYGVMVGVRF